MLVLILDSDVSVCIWWIGVGWGGVQEPSVLESRPFNPGKKEAAAPSPPGALVSRRGLLSRACSFSHLISSWPKSVC